MKARVAALLAALALGVGGVTYVSTQGIEHAAEKEGLRLVAYPDPGTNGVPWTICYGHTRGVKPGMTATPEQCEQWLAEDLYVAEKAVQRRVKVPLTQGQYDALVSFVLNGGEGQFRTSTMLRLFNQGDYEGACNQFPLWVYANKRVLNGLVTRRTEEQAMCLRREWRFVYVPS